MTPVRPTATTPTTTTHPSAAPRQPGRGRPATAFTEPGHGPGPEGHPEAAPGGSAADPLSSRVDALGELLGLSRTRISPDALAETGELLERISERRRLSLDHTVVALAGATGSGKSALFNALAGLPLAETGMRRPTTARPIACAWPPERAAGLLDRLGIAPQDRYTRRHARIPAPAGGADHAAGVDPGAEGLHEAGADDAGDPGGADLGDAATAAGGFGGGPGLPAGDGGSPAGSRLDGESSEGVSAERASLDGLVLIDLPDHDSAAPGHRAQVDRLLQLVDVVVWVLDPEKYADAALHERYLRPLSGHADVTVLVLNQVDRLPGDSADLVLDDLRRLLDEDGLAVGEHGDAGAVVLAASALTGQGVPDLRGVLGQIVAERTASCRRLAADVDRTARRLYPLYVGEGGAGLTDPAREEFVDRLADAVGAAGAGQSAERDWAGAARAACGTPWGRLMGERVAAGGGSPGARQTPTSPVRRNGPVAAAGPAGLVASRPLVGEAARGLAADAARGLPAPWAQAVREAARRGGEGLPAALDSAAKRAEPGPPERPGWWSAAHMVQWLLMALAVAGAVCLSALASGSIELTWWVPVVMAAAGGLGGPLVSAGCRVAARGPARRYGQAAERRLRDAAADCGRARVLEPVAAELMRYREVREQFAVVAGTSPRAPHARDSRSAESHSHSSE
ncbi:50S ribosome-binding GTPase [Streptomyces cocklensis]|uniref:50S ribosome-binding GTPase n=1 Tax=Actinacidiphila cocklensis TaxID=887465 RepID=A0A9W4E5H6_9ACTN|nr:GTPase [Actinacidiphila cocklensis]MDD1058207.1 50S ribosome-binding GTPase [Actinacidiphila cocklensis]CAG6393258.1 50S ribosome-binding GTPase [Actinacidiphila cocklensis]